MFSNMMNSIITVVVIAVSLNGVGGQTTTASPIAFTGYLVDTLCLTIINSNDFTNTTINPENHTMNCLRKSYCEASGYSILEKQGAFYGSKYQIAKADVPKAVAVLNANSCYSNFSVTVTGTMSGMIGDAKYQGASTYNDGAQGFGTVLNILTIEGICGGDVVLPSTTDNADAVTNLDSADSSWHTGVVVGVVICVVAALIVIVYYEINGPNKKLELVSAARPTL